MTSDKVHAEELLDLAHLPADVQSLFDAAEAHDFQNGLDWYRLLASTTLTAADRVSVLVSRRNGQATTALPIRRRERRFGDEVNSLTNFYTSHLLTPMASSAQVEDCAFLFSALRHQQLRARSLTLSPLEHEGREYALLRDGLRQSGLRTFEHFCFGNWYLPLQPGLISADQYFAARPGEVRQTLRRMTRRFEGERGHIEVTSSEVGLERAINAYTTVYAASWKRPEPHPEFMPGLMRLCARRGWLRLGTAWLGERPIAAQLWIVANGRASIYKLAYDSEFARLSPGSLLTATLMRQAIDEDRVEEVDYLTGDDPYKSAWMTHRRERWGLVAYDHRTLGGAWLLARELASKVGKSVVALARGRRANGLQSPHLLRAPPTESAR